jgi:cysteine desulfurase
MSKSNKNSNEKTSKIYLDYAASVAPNPSSIHEFGLNAKKKLDSARRDVADILNARAEEIIFTSGGTESNNLALQGVVLAWHEKNQEKRGGKNLPHIITTNIEHPSVLETIKLLKKRKLAQISIVPVESNGIVSPKKIKKEIKGNTILVSVMYANNEIGTIQPVREIAKEIRHYNKKNEKRKVFERSGWGRDPGNRGPEKTLPFRVFFHTDAVQAANYLDLNVERLGADLLTLSGSKIEGAGRVGVLYKRKSVPLANIFGGGDQEYGFRPGTENLPEIIKFSKAMEVVREINEKEMKRQMQLRNYFFDKLRKTFFFSGPRFPGVPTPARPFKKESFAEFIINGDLLNRLPNNVNITIPKIPSDLLVIELSARGIMASAKSACKSSSAEGSYVIKALRPESDSEIGGVRFSLGRQTKKKDIDYTVKALSEILDKLKKWYG